MSDGSGRTASVSSWDAAPLLPDQPGLVRRSLAGEKSLLMHCVVQAGAVVPRHDHPQEQHTIVLEGGLRFTVWEDGEERCFEAAAGDVATIPGELAHAAEALEASVWIDVFTPIREELLPAA
jgi:quercetin dioxygenase-like cupin family protein